MIQLSCGEYGLEIDIASRERETTVSQSGRLRLVLDNSEANGVLGSRLLEGCQDFMRGLRRAAERPLAGFLSSPRNRPRPGRMERRLHVSSIYSNPSTSSATGSMALGQGVRRDWHPMPACRFAG